MDLPSAISEFAEMLTLGTSALDKLIEREDKEDGPATVKALLSEAHDTARRLSAIADELRRQAAL